MNKIEKLFLGLLVLWLRNRNDRDIAGFNAVLTIYLVLVMHLGTLIVTFLIFRPGPYHTPELPSRATVMVLASIPLAIIALFFLEKKRMARYREMILQLREDEKLRIRRIAFLYAACSIIVFFSLAAILTNYVMS